MTWRETRIPASARMRDEPQRGSHSSITGETPSVSGCSDPDCPVPTASQGRAVGSRRCPVADKSAHHCGSDLAGPSSMADETLIVCQPGLPDGRSHGLCATAPRPAQHQDTPYELDNRPDWAR